MQELRKINLILLIAILYLKFLIQIVLADINLFIDCLLYFILFIAFVDKQINYRILVIVFFAIISLLNPAAKNIFLIFSITYLLRIFSIKELAMINLGFSVIVFIITCFMLWGNIIHPSLFQQTIIDQRERWDFGYGNPNTFALFIYSILANLYILIHERKYVILVVTFLLIGIPVYNYTQSRTFLLSVLLLLICHLITYNSYLRATVYKYRWVMIPIPFLLFYCIFIFSKSSGDNPIMNVILSGRLELYNNFLNSLSISDYLFGTTMVTEDLIDSSYLHLLFEGGFVAFIVFYLLFVMAIKRMRFNCMFIIPLLISFLAYGLTESLFTAVLYFGNMIIWSILYVTSQNINQKYIK